jgi:hypothetical protein
MRHVVEQLDVSLFRSAARLHATDRGQGMQNNVQAQVKQQVPMIGHCSCKVDAARRYKYLAVSFITHPALSITHTPNNTSHFTSSRHHTPLHRPSLAAASQPPGPVLPLCGTPCAPHVTPASTSVVTRHLDGRVFNTGGLPVQPSIPDDRPVAAESKCSGFFMPADQSVRWVSTHEQGG